MAEPQPPNVREGVDIEDEHPTKPASAEDRKAAAALSSLDVRGDDDEASTKKSEADQKALGEAMSRLEVAGKTNTTATKTAKAGDGESTKKKSVKVDQGDVALLVEELDLSKPKATELLKAHEGDAMKAMRAFVTAST